VSSNRVAAGLFLALSCVLIVAAPTVVSTETLGDPGPALMPRIVGIGTAVLAIILFFQTPETPESADGALENPATVGLSLLAIPGFYLLFQSFGYTLAVAFYLVTAFCILGNRDSASRLRYALAATAFSLASGMIFSRLLDLPLPGVVP